MSKVQRTSGKMPNGKTSEYKKYEAALSLLFYEREID